MRHLVVFLSSVRLESSNVSYSSLCFLWSWFCLCFFVRLFCLLSFFQMYLSISTASPSRAQAVWQNGDCSSQDGITLVGKSGSISLKENLRHSELFKTQDTKSSSTTTPATTTTRSIIINVSRKHALSHTSSLHLHRQPSFISALTRAMSVNFAAICRETEFRFLLFASSALHRAFVHH